MLHDTPLNPHAARRRDYTCTQETFPYFLDLPLEIRHLIYEVAILQRQTLRPHPSYEESKKLSHLPGYGHGPLAESAITRVSRLLRAEALPVFYRLRRFPLLAAPLATCGLVAKVKRRGLSNSTAGVAEPGAHAFVDRLHDAGKLALMRSFCVELLIPHHRDVELTVGCVLMIDISPSGAHEVWIGSSWGDNRFLPLEGYWMRVMTREAAGVQAVLDRVRVVLHGVKSDLTRRDVLRLARAAVDQ